MKTEAQIRYITEKLQRFCATLGKLRGKVNPKRVLFLCTGNSARSQMAEGLLRHEAGDWFEVLSAGTRPTAVRPEAIAVMNEIGIDISGHRSKSVDDFVGQEFAYVITVCDAANEACPVFPGNTKRLHWSFEDPAAMKGTEDERKAAFRKVRDQIHERIRTFIYEGKRIPPAAAVQ